MHPPQLIVCGHGWVEVTDSTFSGGSRRQEHRYPKRYLLRKLYDNFYALCAPWLHCHEHLCCGDNTGFAIPKYQDNVNVWNYGDKTFLCERTRRETRLKPLCLAILSIFHFYYLIASLNATPPLKPGLSSRCEGMEEGLAEKNVCKTSARVSLQ